MFVSFFPRPKLFFLSAIAWTALAMAFWYGFADDVMGSGGAGKAVGVAVFWSARSLWFDLYFALSVAVFAGAWMLFAPHPWAPWSILGSALILFTSYFQVEVSVAINTWYGPFYDLVQAALSFRRRSACCPTPRMDPGRDHRAPCNPLSHPPAWRPA